MMAFISSSEMWDISRLPLQTVHGLPACRSSIGPLRNAKATIAFASVAKPGSSVIFINSLHGFTIRRCYHKSSHCARTGSLGAFPRLRPKSRIDRQCAHSSCLRIEESAMMAQFPIPEELRQHGQRTGSKSLVDEPL